MEGNLLYRLRQAAGDKVVLAAVFELVEGKSLGRSCACYTASFSALFFYLKLCVDWVML